MTSLANKTSKHCFLPYKEKELKIVVIVPMISVLHVE